MNVTKGNINSVLNTTKLVVLFFSNPTCGPCKGAKISLGLVQKSHTNVVYGFVNTHGDEEVPNRYNVKTTPTLVFIKQNKEVGRLTGGFNTVMILSIMKSHLDKRK